MGQLPGSTSNPSLAGTDGPPDALGPTSQPERIFPLDALRGFAVLGILVMNIQAFSMVSAAYFNPTAAGDLRGTNFLVWLLGHVLADMKFMTIFALLFGAGIVLMAERLEGKGRNPTPMHYRRMVVLLVAGLAHGWLLWSGDVLYTYAMCGFCVYLFRKMPPGTLVLLGLSCIFVASALSLSSQLTMPHWPRESVLGMKEMWAPTSAQVQAEVAAMTGGWFSQLAHRAPKTLAMETFVFLFNLSWRAGGVMLVGMGLFKLGVLSGGLSPRAYRRMILAGVILGFPLILLGVWFQHATGWSLETGFFGGLQFNYWGSLPVALGWVAAIMLLCQARPRSRLVRSLGATGQMAFTNYIMQTVICTALFYGHGFGLFGTVDRTGQLLVVFSVWALQLTISPWWLSRFRFGPLEWGWRTLTYGKVQPLRRASVPSD